MLVESGIFSSDSCSNCLVIASVAELLLAMRDDCLGGEDRTGMKEGDNEGERTELAQQQCCKMAYACCRSVPTEFEGPWRRL